ncbi:MAG: Non-canonical purine NTP pyrophosphatase [Alphaproteobacteria bacterium MarineAlpha9_Bin3]|nr:MAG: Non-canonical purine NTP pyrophosphatase [Alphaproteobacteria bacterium MarineAlpha9_Bin3]|tara:strand:+ start:5204 stop:5809 length:606 start_codon:yes stop_codon:yes gene_type:complete
MKNKIKIPREIVIASHNEGKVKEINTLLNDIGIKALPISNFSDIEPIENGNSFKENALIKARNAKKLSNTTSLADDSGLCVEGLNGAPGIYSARWAGPKKDFNKAMLLIEEKLKNINNKKAYFICALALVNEKNEEYVFEGKINGTLTFPKKGEMGFGYDPIFIPKNNTMTFGEMDPLKKELISHRAIAFKKFKENIIVNK